MSFATDINRYFTMGAASFSSDPSELMKQLATKLRVRPKIEDAFNLTRNELFGWEGVHDYVEYVAGARHAIGRRRLAVNKAQSVGWFEAVTSRVLRLAVLEHQAGVYRVFSRLTGALIDSHEFRLEAIRRAERDGWHFGDASV